jgi:hypothetical protein
MGENDMNQNVVRFPRPAWEFDQDVTQVIAMVTPTPPHGIPFSALLEGPASDPNLSPQRHPRPVPRWVSSTSLVTIGWALGVLMTFTVGRF